MNPERKLSCVISGSFDKFKPEIDLAIDSFTELGVNVLAPGKGWLYVPQERRPNIKTAGFRPLPSEIGRNIREIEEDFLRELAKSDFHYVVNINGYIGPMAAFEIGFAVGKGIPVYAKEDMSSFIELDGSSKIIQSKIKVLSPEQVVFDVKNQNR